MRDENVNPYRICDGKWGGFGPSYWIHAEHYDLGQRNVLEWRFKEGRQEWWRIWVDVEKKWRDLATEELAKLPAFGERKPIRFDAVAWIPPKSPEEAEAIATIITQPVLQVIEQAPVLREVFARKTL